MEHEKNKRPSTKAKHEKGQRGKLKIGMAIKDTDFHSEEDLQIGKGHGLLRKVNSMEYLINKAESLVRKKI